MAELKTKENEASVEKFLKTVEDETKRNDCFTIAEIMKQVTRSEPKMWGGAIVGFGSYHYKYNSGHEGDMCLTGFSPRKQAITIYIIEGLHSHPELLQKLGKHKTGSGCLYIKKLDDIDVGILKQLIKASIDSLKNKYSKTLA